MTVNLHRLAEERSLAAHRRIAERLEIEPDLVLRARARLGQWEATGSVTEHYRRAWAAWLELPLHELARKLVATDEEARALRQVTPFAGALAPRERWQIWKRVRMEQGR